MRFFAVDSGEENGMIPSTGGDPAHWATTFDPPLTI